MATKANTIRDALEGKGCLGKAQPDEPVFVLRANDPLAADVVLYWAARATATRVFHESAKVDEAAIIARAMSDWRNARERERVIASTAAASAATVAAAAALARASTSAPTAAPTQVQPSDTRVIVPPPPASRHPEGDDE
jgi:hypothetical protein